MIIHLELLTQKHTVTALLLLLNKTLQITVSVHYWKILDRPRVSSVYPSLRVSDPHLMMILEGLSNFITGRCWLPRGLQWKLTLSFESPDAKNSHQLPIWVSQTYLRARDLLIHTEKIPGSQKLTARVTLHANSIRIGGLIRAAEKRFIGRS